MIRRIWESHINNLRRISQENRIRSQDISTDNVNIDEPDVVIGTPAAVGGVKVGRTLRKFFIELGIGLKKIATAGSNPNPDFENVGLSSALKNDAYRLITFAIQAIISFLIIGSLGAATSAHPILLPIMILTAFFPNIYVYFKYSRKEKETKQRLENKIGNYSVEDIEFAVENINHMYEPIRVFALILTAEIISGSPGKALKQTSYDEDYIGKELAEAIPEVSEETAAKLLDGIVWLSRDHPESLQSYAKLFKKLMKVNSTAIQIPAIEILGFIGRVSSNKPGYVDAIAPAVSDKDADVREAVAIALGRLPCEKAIQLLEQLMNDPDATVQQQASQSLNALDIDPE